MLRYCSLLLMMRAKILATLNTDKALYSIKARVINTNLDFSSNNPSSNHVPILDKPWSIILVLSVQCPTSMTGSRNQSGHLPRIASLTTMALGTSSLKIGNPP